MNYVLAKKLFICFVIGFFIVSFNLYGSIAGSISIQWGESDSSEDSQAVKTSKKSGPPAHAPAHGYRAKYQYKYYPSSSVYYDTDRQLYFYLKGDDWQIGASLPSSLSLVLGDYVSIELDTDKPYTYYSEHLKQYPPGQSKEKNKNKKKNKWG
jgi:hypothetical protein